MPKDRFKGATIKNTLMKKTFLPLVLCLAIGSSAVRAESTNEGGTPSKKNILSDKLPTSLRTKIKNNYKDYWITDLYQEKVNGKVSYHITVENAEKIIKLTTVQSGNWSIVHVVPKGQPGS
jgi:hypothetical protein